MMLKNLHQATKEKARRRRKQQIRTTKTSRKTSNGMEINTYLSIITLNIIQLNVSIKRHRVAEWIKNEAPSRCCL